MPHSRSAPDRPNPLDLLRLGLEGLTLPMSLLERWIDRLEGTR